MPIDRSQFPSMLRKDIDLVFGETIARNPEEWRGVYEVTKPDQVEHRSTLIGGFGVAPEKAEGADVALDDAHEVWTRSTLMRTIALGFEYTEEQEEDNQYFKIARTYTPELARSFIRAKETYAADIFNNAFAAGVTYGDGKSLLDVDRPLQRGGTWSNKLAVDADLSEDALRSLLIQMRKNKSDNGDFQKLRAVRMIIPPDLEYVAEVVLKSAHRPGTMDNDINPIESKRIFGSEPHIMTYITNTTGWYVQTDVPNGFMHFDYVPMKTRTYVDSRSGSMGIVKRERYAFDVINPRAVFGSQ